MHYILFYDVVEGYVERREPFRAAHLKRAQAALNRGELVLGGALADPADGAVLVFREAEAAERFASSDPYVLNGAVKSWRVRKWNTVVGDGASTVASGSAPPSAKAWTPGRPEASEYAAYAKSYVDLVEGDDILHALEVQLDEALALLQALTPEQAASPYAPGKWTVKEVLGHVIDAERVFAYRALCIARGDQTAFPSFEQDDYIRGADFNRLPLESLICEFRAVRQSTCVQFRNLPDDSWTERGTVSNYSATARGIAFTAAGHERHHMNILREKFAR